jgi:hypothetical protein
MTYVNIPCFTVDLLVIKLDSGILVIINQSLKNAEILRLEPDYERSGLID